MISFTRHVEVAFAKYVHTEPDAEGDAHIHGGIYVDVRAVVFFGYSMARFGNDFKSHLKIPMILAGLMMFSWERVV